MAVLTEDWRSGGFGIYLHWPFCEAKCPYCDFNSHVSSEIDVYRWLSAYLKELDSYAKLLPDRVLNSVFFGGGTPSLMHPDMVASILERIQSHWTSANDLEITLEANPSSVEAQRFEAFAKAGVNRVSLGVQALNDDDLKRLGRLHTAKEAINAYEIARQYFNRVSFDLIYARQDQTLDDWRTELSQALELAVDHLSLYQLTIEPGTVFAKRLQKGGLKGLPSEDVSADMYELTEELCSAAGYMAYEVSNYAKPGAESRHNMIYWRYGDYVGIGPGAHGRISVNGDRFETEAWSHPDRWLSSVESNKPLKSNNILSNSEQAKEHLLMGLRLREGIDLVRQEQLSSNSINLGKIEDFQKLGLIELHNDRLSATPAGRLVLNSLVEALTSD